MMEILLAQLEREARTRKALERVPEGKNDWKPHEKSMPLGYLAALCAGDRVLAEEPRYVMILDGVFAHLAHHRGQWTVYLRLNNVAVPALFGGSADER